ncbi:MAG: DM13 domain-containing protein [Gammaproteobacteria bacterium]|nr:DM13 domain-containing protein [Gammaproteobacteria bacterium]
MPAEERALREQALMAALRDQGATATTEAMPQMPVDDAPVLLRRGQFSDVDAVHRGSGDALLYALPDGAHLLRLENFRTSNGPDLHVYLARHPMPARAADVEQGYLDLGKLKGNIGNQNYPVPAGTALEEYGSVVIWCQLFGVLFSPAPLADVQP